ncbi:hypothetical protein ACM2LR_25375, partial [Escherichia coli]
AGYESEINIPRALAFRQGTLLINRVFNLLTVFRVVTVTEIGRALADALAASRSCWLAIFAEFAAATAAVVAAA